MIFDRAKSLLLRIALGAHNAATFTALNLVMWRNGLWREERWTSREKKKAGDEISGRVSQLAPGDYLPSSSSNIS